MKLRTAIFEFQLNDNSVYSAHWWPNETAPDLAEKHEVAIFNGGSYILSYYSNYNVNKSNSIDYIKKYLQTIQTLKV